MSLNKAIVGEVLAITLAAGLSLVAVSPSSAAPISNGAALKQAVPDGITDVHWREGHRHWGWHRHHHHHHW